MKLDPRGVEAALNEHYRLSSAMVDPRDRVQAALSAYFAATQTVPVPVEPTEEMLRATCDDQGRPRILEFTAPEERSKAFLMARYIYRAMLAAVRQEEG